MFLVSIVVKETKYSIFNHKKKKKKTKYEAEYHTPNNIFL